MDIYIYILRGIGGLNLKKIKTNDEFESHSQAY